MDQKSVWIFGYGSLVWRPAFEFKQRKGGYIKNYKRRFWQGSTDHRGVPGSPGRVVTLISSWESESIDYDDTHSAGHVWGMCYEIAPEKVQETLDYLDYREKGGYSRSLVEVYESPDDTEPHLSQVLLYTATIDNPEFLGPAPLEHIANQIATSIGPSGHNFEYLMELHKALKQHNIYDDHVEELVKLVCSIKSQQTIENVH